MPRIPLFDSLTHPTLDGDWILPRYRGAARIGPLRAAMAASGVRWGFAVGMRGIGGYDEKRFARFIAEHSAGLFPIAYLDLGPRGSVRAIAARMRSLKKSGYAGVKISPRLSKITLDHPALPSAVKAANDAGLAVLLCTYFHDSAARSWKNSPEALLRLLGKAPGDKIVMLHGGGVRLLEFMEIARAFPNILLDLSLTLCKYDGSSLDLDVRFLFRSFDRRICVGSDHPEFSPADLRRRFDAFARGLPREKAENIAFRNILTFTGLAAHV